MRKVTGKNFYMSYSAQITQKQDEHNIYVIIKKYTLISSSCFCEIWALCVSWITYDHLYYNPCLPCCALFGSLVTAMCNRIPCAQVHTLPQNYFLELKVSCWHSSNLHSNEKKVKFTIPWYLLHKMTSHKTFHEMISREISVSSFLVSYGKGKPARFLETVILCEAFRGNF